MRTAPEDPVFEGSGSECSRADADFEFDEMESTRVVDGERLYNYWGYNTVCFLRPIPVIPRWWNITTRAMS